MRTRKRKRAAKNAVSEAACKQLAPVHKGKRCCSVHNVLNTPKLQELIWDYAVHDQNAEKLLKTLRSLRLVNKIWLKGITLMLSKKKEPMFKLMLTRNNINGTPTVEVHRKLLDEFATTIANRVVKEPFPTFSLYIWDPFFRRENLDSLISFMRQCARGLVELRLVIPKNGGSFPGFGLIPMVEFPILQILELGFTNMEVEGNISGNELDFGNSTNEVCLIYSFLSRTKSLKKLMVIFIDGGQKIFNYVPFGFEIVTLPVSITYLYLACKMTYDQLEMLNRNKLPNLLLLCLELYDVSYSERLVSFVLTNICKQLQKLDLKWEPIDMGPHIPVCNLFFPISKDIGNQLIPSNGIDLGNHHPIFRAKFPECVVSALLQNCTSSPPLSSVRKLEISVQDKNERSSDTTVHFIPESMQRVHLAFPNVRQLKLEIYETDASGLQYIFMEMRQLVELRIDIEKENESISNSDYWDSILTGIPVSLVKALRERPVFWNHFEVKKTAPSIKMLSELTTFVLNDAVKISDTHTGKSLILDLTFRIALLNMPKLLNLSFNGRFSASDAMKEAWKSKVRMAQQ